MQTISTYIRENLGDIIVEAFFVTISIILPLILAKKDTNPVRTNTTSMQQTIIYIKQTIINVKSDTNETIPQNSHTYQDSNGGVSNSGLIEMFVILLFIALLYSKYHIQIINYFTGFTILVLISTITLSIKLYVNNNYDRLNKWWTLLMVAIIIFNLLTIALMKNQDVNINNGISMLTKVLYYVAGLAFSVIPNIIILTLIIHLFALNSFLSRKGRISLFFLQKTELLYRYPIVFSTIAIIFLLFGLFFSSGIAWEIFDKHSNENVNNLMKTINQ